MSLFSRGAERKIQQDESAKAGEGLPSPSGEQAGRPKFSPEATEARSAEIKAVVEGQEEGLQKLFAEAEQKEAGGRLVAAAEKLAQARAILRQAEEEEQKARQDWRREERKARRFAGALRERRRVLNKIEGEKKN